MLHQVILGSALEAAVRHLLRTVQPCWKLGVLVSVVSRQQHRLSYDAGRSMLGGPMQQTTDCHEAMVCLNHPHASTFS